MNIKLASRHYTTAIHTGRIKIFLHLLLWIVLFGSYQDVLANENMLLDKASWIWHSRDKRIQKHKRYYFRKDLFIEGTVKSAYVKLTAEGKCKLSVNGREIGRNEKWNQLSEYDIQQDLIKGNNDIVVEVIPNNWYAGMFAAGKIYYSDRESFEFKSDDTWHSWTEENQAIQKAEIIVKGVDGGFWCNVTPFKMPGIYNNPNLEISTPHIAWAKPYCGRKLKILALISRRQHLEIAELVQRMDARIDVVFCDYTKKGKRLPFFRPIEGATKADVKNSIKRAFITKYDVIVLGEISQDVFYGEVALRLKTMVEEGTGLFYSKLPGIKNVGNKNSIDRSYETTITATTINEKPKELVVGLPFSKLPAFKIHPNDTNNDYTRVFLLYQFGQGRIVRNIRPGKDTLLIPDGDDSDLHYEYYQSFAIKSLLWAAKCTSSIKIIKFPSAIQIDQNDPDKKKITFQLQKLKTVDSIEAFLNIRSAVSYLNVPSKPNIADDFPSITDQIKPIYSDSINVGKNMSIEFDIPDLPIGEYFADVVCKVNGKNANWAVSHITISNVMQIAKVRLDPEYVDYTKQKSPCLNAIIRFTKPVPKGTAIRFGVIDGYNRLVCDKYVIPDPGIDFLKEILNIPPLLTTLGRLRVELLDNMRTIDISITSFSTIRKDWDRFIFTGWADSGTRSRQERILAQLLQNIGFDAQRDLSGSIARLAVSDIKAFPRTGGKRIQQIELDQNLLEATRGIVTKKVEQSIPFDPVGYVTSDEISYGGGERLPARLDAFRKSLCEKYGTIEKLNAQWETTYGSFGEIPPITTKTAASFYDRVPLTLNLSPIVDQYLENCKVYAEHFEFFQKSINLIDPYARFGIESPLWPWAKRCFDWYAILQKTRLFSPYGREGDIQTYEFARSFARPNMMLGMTYGGYNYNGFIRRPETTDLEFQRWRPWNSLLRGFNWIHWYKLGATRESGVGPGMLPYPAFLTACNQIKKIRQGYFTLFRGTDRHKNSVAIHYSVPSNIVADYFRDFGQLPWDVHMLIRSLQNYLGIGYDFIATPQIENGDLKNYKVLLMPLSQAIGHKEAVEIQAFVKNGGLVIADVRPGLTDGHGKFGGQPLIRELFGIDYEVALRRKTIKQELKGSYRGFPFAISEQKIPVDPCTVLNGAEASLEIEEIPILATNKTGSGNAVLLNLPFNWYRHHPTPDTLYYYLEDPDHASLVAQLLKAVFKAHGIRPILTVESSLEKWSWGLETWYRADGLAYYVGLTKRRAQKVEKQLSLMLTSPAPGHVYDMFNGQYHGYTQSWPVKIDPADVRLFSLLPYVVQGLAVKSTAKVIERGDSIKGVVSVLIGEGVPVRHVIHLDVTRPDGEPVRYLARNLETVNGSAKFSLPTAFNEMKGEYILTLTDVASKIQARETVTID